MELKTQMRAYVMKHLSTYRDIYQFSWSNDLDLLSNIGMRPKTKISVLTNSSFP